MKVYRGAAVAARNYLDADRSRADDYYLAEGTGVGRRFSAGPAGPVVELASLSGDGYETWVAGLDPATGEPRGRVRSDANAVRFVEVIVNGPKSWSLAAELHPDVAAAYEAAQDRAAEQIIGWLGAHATTRVGPRGAQVAVPVERLEAVTVRHYTSRAGDPHRHLHLQVNARVFAAGSWRGVDTVAFRDSLAALNGIGHAAVACDPDFRAALAAHGYTLTPDGEITQLAQFVGPFSKRTAQIANLLDRYEAQWRREHAGVEPGPALRRAWDARAWAEDRPDKVVPHSGEQLRQRWLDELTALGYRDPDQPTQLALELPGRIDRDAAAGQVVARLGADRSAWNAADLRGQVEQLLARHHLIADPRVRGELAEDVTDRALARCVRLHDSAVPEHVRALTSQQVLDVEADLVTRLATRGTVRATQRRVTQTRVADVDGLDEGQRAAAVALTGDAALVVVEGAAGAGKTTTLVAVRAQLGGQGQRMLVVTPTRKAAQAATSEIGARAGSAAWFAWQHGWRWESGEWTRIAAVPAPEARLSSGDLLLVDEAGMLDQDTARALLTIADQTGARMALVGDRHQLPAVGRGGVLDLAHRWVTPTARIELDRVHRFQRRVEGEMVPDRDYARLTLAMRNGDDPAAVFDALMARDQVRVHGSELERRDALAQQVSAQHDAAEHAGGSLVVVDTRERAAEVNAAVRERRVADGSVDDHQVGMAHDGQRVGAGDVIVTRRNDTELGVANRESWTVTRVHTDGRLAVHAAGRGRRVLPPGYVRAFVELGYAVTGYGAQGDTTGHAHLVLTEKTSAALAFVAMTRGRFSNTAHLVAADLDDAREQWMAACALDRADLGPAAARDAARRAAAGYRPLRPEAEVVAELWRAWDERADAEGLVRRDQPLLDRALAAQPRVAAHQAAERDAWQRHEQARHALTAARDELAALEQVIDRDATGIADRLRAAWDADRLAAQADARRIQRGTGRFGRGRSEVDAATDRLVQWAARWQPIVGDLSPRWGLVGFAAAHPGNDHDLLRRWGLIGFAAAHPGNDHVDQSLREHAHQHASAAHRDEHAARTDAITRADQHAQAARRRWQAASEHRARHAGPDDHLATPAGIGRLRERLDHAHRQLESADHRFAALRSDPVVLSCPDADRWLTDQQDAWRRHRDQHHADQARAAEEDAHRPLFPRSAPWQPVPTRPGPSLGR